MDASYQSRLHSAKRSLFLFRTMSVFLIITILFAFNFEAVMALFDNGGFEAGTFDSWSKTTFSNPGLSCTTGGSCIVRNPGGLDKTNIVGAEATAPMSIKDANVNAYYPRFGSFSAVVNYMGANNNANTLYQTTTVTAEDIDPTDGKVHIRFAYMPVMENPGHTANEQPYFYIGVKNVTKGGVMLYDKFAFSAQEGVPWQGSGVLYTDWQIVDIAPGNSLLAVGDTIELEVVAAGCSQSGHYGYVYVDAFGAFLPGLSVAAIGPESISATQDITFTYNWANTGQTTVDNVVLTAVVPTNTTYVSNDSGCTLSGSTVTCNLGSKGPSATGSVHITYKVNSGASGSVNHGNYQISGDGFAPIIGPLVSTTINPDFPPSSFSSGTPGNGLYGQAYNFDFNANGDPAAGYSVSAGSLPPGLTLNSASGMLSGTPTAAGTFNFTIQAANYLGGITQAHTISIQKASTITNVTRSVANPVYGQPLSLTASVSPVFPATFTPAGQVEFYIDGDLFATVPLSGGSATSPVTTSVSAGDHTYQAVYVGDSNNFGSNSGTATALQVGQNSTTTSVVSSAPTSVYGQPLTLTATVDEVLPSIITPMGQVQFYVDGSPLGSPVNLNGSGVAVSAPLHSLLPSGHLLVGEHNYRAVYLGNSNSVGSSQGPLTQTINQAPTNLVVSSSETPTVYGTSLQMTITVTQNAPSIVTPAGRVQLTIDGVLFGTPLTLDSAGKAVRTVPYLNMWPGNHAVTAVYSPADPAQFVGSNNHSAPLTQVVNKANPIFTLTQSAESPVASQPISYSVLVGPSMITQGTPSGKVQFFVDGSPLGSPVELDGTGRANSPISGELSAGNHSITVQYSGDDYFLTIPTSPAHPLSISKADASVQIVSIEPAASVVGQPVTVRVQADPVSPATDAPAGTVTVSNGVDSCLAALDSNGAGSCELEPTSPGSPDLSAEYSGSPNFNSASADPFSGPVVAKADASVTISGFNPAEPVTGQPVTFTFTVLPVAPGWGTPTGNVTISDGLGRSCTASVQAGSCEINFDAAGITSLTAAYEGDSNFNPSGSTATSGPEVKKASTSLALTSSDNASVYGQPVEFTAALSVTEPGSGLPTGQIQFSIDGVSFGQPTDLVNGVAVSQSIMDLPVTTHTVQAQYLGDADFLTSSSTSINQTVGKADTTLVLSSSQNPSPYGLSVLVTATITGNDPSIAIPGSGSVQFVVDGVNYGAPMPVNSNGEASKLLPYTALWVGTHNITAYFTGNESFNASNNAGNPLLQVVEKGLLSFILAPTIESPVFGQPFGFTITVLGQGANNPLPSGTVQFAVDGVDLGTPVTLDEAAFAASELISSLSVGPHSITISYSGDDYYGALTETAAAAVKVEKASVDADITAPIVESILVGQPITISFSVSALAPGNGTPTGLVTIRSGLDSCTAPVEQGFCELVPSSAGMLELTIEYEGDDHFNQLPAGDPITGPHVNPASVTVTIPEPPTGPFVVGQLYPVTVLVQPVAPSTLIPVGQQVTLSNGSDSCTANVAEDGTATCEIKSTGSGTPQLGVSFDGGDNFNDATSEPVSGPVVDAAETTSKVRTSQNPIVVGEAVQFTATVQVVAPGSGTPGGQVQFIVDGENFGEPVELVNGQAVSAEWSTLDVANHAIGVNYLGSTDFNGSQSTSITQKVVNGDLSIKLQSGQPTTVTVPGLMSGVPVTTTILIPDGAVSPNTVLVFRQFSANSPAPVSGYGSVTHFTLDAYEDGILQSNLTLNEAIQVTIEYNPKNWEESSFIVRGWDGSQWTTTGISSESIDAENNTITFSLSELGALDFNIMGTYEFFYYMPIVRK